MAAVVSASAARIPPCTTPCTCLWLGRTSNRKIARPLCTLSTSKPRRSVERLSFIRRRTSSVSRLSSFDILFVIAFCQFPAALPGPSVLPPPDQATSRSPNHLPSLFFRLRTNYQKLKPQYAESPPSSGTAAPV